MAKTEIYNFFETVYMYVLYDPTYINNKFYIGKLKQHLNNIKMVAQ